MERTWTFLRLAAVAAGCLLSVATSAPEGGERTGDDDDDSYGADGGVPDNCPAGETCSPETPYGLYFGAPAFSDDPLFEIIAPPPTAVGGRQTITLYRDAAGEQPLWLALDAVTADPSVLDVVAAAAPAVTVHASAEGSTYLRVLEAGTDLLFDRATIRATEIASAELRLAREDQPAWWADEVPLIAVGSHANLVVALSDAYGNRIADTTASVVRPASWPDDPTRWDVFQAKPEAAATYVLAIDAGGRRFDASVEAVDAIDAIVYDGGRTEVPVSVEPTARFCFRAENGGRQVLVSWQFSARGDLAIAQDQVRGCVLVGGLQPGSGTLSAIAMGRELALDLDVITEAAANRAPKDPPLAPLDLTPGDRAAR